MLVCANLVVHCIFCTCHPFVQSLKLHPDATLIFAPSKGLVHLRMFNRVLDGTGGVQEGFHKKGGRWSKAVSSFKTPRANSNVRVGNMTGIIYSSSLHVGTCIAHAMLDPMHIPVTECVRVLQIKLPDAGCCLRARASVQMSPPDGFSDKLEHPLRKIERSTELCGQMSGTRLSLVVWQRLRSTWSIPKEKIHREAVPPKVCLALNNWELEGWSCYIGCRWALDPKDCMPQVEVQRTMKAGSRTGKKKRLVGWFCLSACLSVCFE